jgi:hypothetical protein
MNLKPTDPIELIKAESLILQVLSQLQQEQGQTRDIHAKQVKEFQVKALADFINLYRDTMQAYKLEIMNQRARTLALQKWSEFFLNEKHAITDDFINALKNGLTEKRKN